MFIKPTTAREFGELDFLSLKRPQLKVSSKASERIKLY